MLISMYLVTIFNIIFVLICIDAKIQIYITDGPVQKIGTRYYKKQLLTNEFQDPKELAYDSDSRTLYFSYMDDDIQNSGRAGINVVTNEAKKIKGIEKNKATAVDADTGEVYFGSEDGLYKYNSIDNEAVNIGLYNMNILQLIIRNNEMYLIDANNHMLYKVFNGNSAVKVGNMGNLIIFDVDNKRNVHFVSLCGLYCAIEGHEVVKNKDLPFVYHFIVDNNRTLGVTENAIYELDCWNGTANKISDLDFFPRSIIYGDYGDIYYSIDSEIYCLKPLNSYIMYELELRKKTPKL